MVWVLLGCTRSRYRQPYEYLLVHQAGFRRLVGTHKYHVQIALDGAASASFELLHPAFCVDRGKSLLYTHEKEALVRGRGMVRAVGQRARQTRLTNAKSQVGSRGQPLAATLPFAGRTQLQRGGSDASGGKRWQFRREHLKHTPHRFRAATISDMCPTYQAAALLHAVWLRRTLLEHGQEHGQACRHRERAGWQQHSGMEPSTLSHRQ